MSTPHGKVSAALACSSPLLSCSGHVHVSAAAFLQGASIGDVFVSTGKMHHDRRIPLPGFDKQVGCSTGCLAHDLVGMQHDAAVAVHAQLLTGSESRCCICVHQILTVSFTCVLPACPSVPVCTASAYRALAMWTARPHPTCRPPCSSRQALSHQVGGLRVVFGTILGQLSTACSRAKAARVCACGSGSSAPPSSLPSPNSAAVDISAAAAHCKTITRPCCIVALVSTMIQPRQLAGLH